MEKGKGAPPRARAVGLLAALVPGVLPSACTTPTEVQEASRAQLELLRELDAAVVELQRALDEHHADKAELIVETARVEVAQQAIDVAVGEDSPPVPLGVALNLHERDVGPWVVAALGEQALAAELDELEAIEREDGELSPELAERRAEVEAELARFDAKPDEIRDIEEVRYDELVQELETAAEVHGRLDVLRALSLIHI